MQVYLYHFSFLGIKIGDTPENSQFSKLALEWIIEFETLIGIHKNFQ